MQLARRHPKLLQGMILCSTSPTVSPLPEGGGEPAPSLASRAEPGVLAIAKRMLGGEITQESIATFFGRVGPYYAGPSRMDVPDWMLSLSSMSIELMRHFMSTIAPNCNLRPKLSRTTDSTLVIVGRHDWICPPRAGRAIAHRISDAKQFEDAGRFLFSEEPDGFLNTVTAVLGICVLALTACDVRRVRATVQSRFSAQS
jgi:pimeloyl-ACP methyl ester carboxylesterase